VEVLLKAIHIQTARAFDVTGVFTLDINKK